MTPADPETTAGFARTPEPPYYAVVFSSRRTPGDHGYAEMAVAMEAMALAQPGCLGVESARGGDGFGITVSYWRDTDSIRAWKAKAAHLAVQRRGRANWYSDYAVRVAKVERAYDLTSSGLDAAPVLESLR